ncbi:MAG: MAPEG family protein [Gammaproteobacteria bacterium]
MIATLLSLENPAFRFYVIAASLMLLKLMLQPWMTVYRMLKVHGGFRNPEDLRKSPANPNPRPEQIEPNDYVERSRRINQNDLESIPGFLAAGLLFVLANPPLVLAAALYSVYVVFRILHFLAYSTAQLHDIRAALWTPASLAVLIMIAYVLLAALSTG